MKLFGIFGFPLKHTLSPEMHNAAFQKLGLEAVYLPFELPPLEFTRLMRELKKTSLSGFNVTVPFKEKIMPFLDVISREAAAVGAVNTVLRRGKSFYGYNTDIDGFARSLREAGFTVKGKRVTVLGAGGAARACVYALLKEKAAAVTVLNRTPERGKKLLADMRVHFKTARLASGSMHKEKIKEVLSETDLLINATSVGLKKEDRLLVSKDLFPKRRIMVCDLIYRPARTPLLETAAALGNRTLNGLPMLLYQGAGAFEIWTGKSAPAVLMKRKLARISHRFS